MLETRVGSYRIVEKLAQGGMGEVYIAYHDLMKREAVVKLLHPKLLHDDDVVQRFLNEARAAAAIEHPGIVKIYDLGRSHGQVYIIMERLRGETLAERVANGTLDVALSVSLTRQLASALDAAHKHDIVHRDLKPENLFVVPDREVQYGERIKILDFGVAKLAPDQAGGNMTAQGTIFGTPAYMAPEQCENAAKVDARSDLYAVGCIMYEMLCGQPPFGRGGLELFAAHLRDTPPPLTDFDDTIPEDVERIVLQLLEKKPEDRFQNCEALYQALAAADLTPRQGTGRVKRVSALAFAATVAPDSIDGDSLIPGSPGPIERAVANSPTTHRSATGEVAALDQDEKAAGNRSSRRGVIWLAAVALALLAGAGVTLKVVSDRRAAEEERAATQTPDTMVVAPVTDGTQTPDTVTEGEPGSEFLALGEAALKELRWEDAMLAARQALEVAPEGSAVHQRATEIQESAREAQKYEWAYQIFNEAVEKKDVRGALYAFEQLPEDSYHRERATEAYQALRDEWLAPYVAKAKKLADKGRCRNIDEITTEVGFMFAESAEVIDDIARKCRSERKQSGDGKDKPEEKPEETKPPEVEEPPPLTEEELKMLPKQVPDFTIRQKLAEKRKGITACAIENPVEAPVEATLVIAPTGKIEAFKLEGHDALRDCVWLQIRGLVFTPAREPTTKTFMVGNKVPATKRAGKKRTRDKKKSSSK